MHAIGRTIEALRQIDRDGVSDFLNRVFTGFPGLPSPTGPNCWDVLQMSPTKDRQAIDSRFKELAKIKHPDAGGNDADFIELQLAKKEALDLC